MRGTRPAIGTVTACTDQDICDEKTRMCVLHYMRGEGKVIHAMCQKEEDCPTSRIVGKEEQKFEANFDKYQCEQFQCVRMPREYSLNKPHDMGYIAVSVPQ